MELQEPPLAKMLQTMDQSTQYEIRVNSKFPRHYIHHSALVHADSRPEGSKLEPLDTHMYQAVISALRDNWLFKRKMSSGNEVCYEDLATVSEGNWLNDISLYEYLLLICKRSTEEAGADLEGNFQCIAPYFGVDLQNGEPLEKLRKITSRVKLKEARGIFVPINIQGRHWTLLVLDLPNRKVFTLDSGERFHGVSLEAIGWIVAQYVRNWAFEEQLVGLNDVWEVIRREVPQQTNSSDCGTFVAQFARKIALDNSNVWEVKQDDMRHLRKKMIQELFYDTLFPM